MSDLVITANNVIPSGNAVTRQAPAGVNLTAGQQVYLDTNGVLQLANAVTNAITASAIGTALHAAAAGQPCDYQIGGDITIGATLVAGEVYVISGAVSGNVAPKGDLVATWITNVMGIALSTTKMSLKYAMPSTPVAHG